MSKTLTLTIPTPPNPLRKVASVGSSVRGSVKARRVRRHNDRLAAASLDLQRTSPEFAKLMEMLYSSPVAPAAVDVVGQVALVSLANLENKMVSEVLQVHLSQFVEANA